MQNQIIDATPIWPFIVIIVSLAAALAWFAWQYWMLSRNIYLNKIEEPKGNAKVNKLEAQLKDYEKAFNKLNPIVERFVVLRDGMRDVAEKPLAKDKLETLQALMGKVKLWDKNLSNEDGKMMLANIFDVAKELAIGEDTIHGVHKKIQQFYGLLRTVDLDEVTERQIRSEFLELAMLMMDVLESINNPNYNEGTHGINVKLVKEEISLDEAVAMTSPVTYLDIETSPWAQKLFKSIEKWAMNNQQPLIEQRHYILNGQRFEFNQ